MCSGGTSSILTLPFCQSSLILSLSYTLMTSHQVDKIVCVCWSLTAHTIRVVLSWVDYILYSQAFCRRSTVFCTVAICRTTVWSGIVVYVANLHQWVGMSSILSCS